MKQNWNNFYNKIKIELLSINSETNEPYLFVLQKNTILIEEWITKSNIKDYIKIFSKFNIKRFNQKDVSLYSFYFDWCNIHEELYFLYKSKPSSFEEFITKIYYTYDFLLSYNSLIDNPENINSELYYVQSLNGSILYESKFPPQLYDRNLTKIDYLVKFDYCDIAILEKENLLRKR
ncbi:hypothetical protein [Capnocytophaga catalasegens]|uniref:Uncharacterized protein n=1 Tax=Capnocytophaga catalasegens TaxID=1004260 RepID=A0AAV5AZH7_9FLAO|nr:hypothetical protein [Capnocytophaga catalasegens]GIZ16598.1 hypothetical protein RCZ03_25980 [Capnocytophaga catalasegens]GJM51410.1 hypothetical protein RCZ15_23830 [Capnocytophaga catalasegens]GJM51793.1 hypothetical protein RCZ16_01110 [Capnocytophaga catalasegens]